MMRWLDQEKLSLVWKWYFGHDDVIKWKYFPRCWPYVRGIHRSPVNSPHKGQWRGALVFSLISACINASVNNREAGDLRHHLGHYDVIVMVKNLNIFCNHQNTVFSYTPNREYKAVRNRYPRLLAKIAFVPICACEDNRRIWSHNASTSRSRDARDQLWWRHSAKLQMTLRGDNGEMSFWWLFLAELCVGTFYISVSTSLVNCILDAWHL